MTQRFVAVLAVVSVFFLVNFFVQDKTSKSMSVEELKQKMLTDSSLVILDVRTPEELQGELGKSTKQ
jgi:hypothetical protein